MLENAKKRNSSRKVESRKLLVDGKQRKRYGELVLEQPVERALPAVDLDGVPPLQGKGIESDGCTCESMFYMN